MRVRRGRAQVTLADQRLLHGPVRYPNRLWPRTCSISIIAPTGSSPMQTTRNVRLTSSRSCAKMRNSKKQPSSVQTRPLRVPRSFEVRDALEPVGSAAHQSSTVSKLVHAVGAALGAHQHTQETDRHDEAGS